MIEGFRKSVSNASKELKSGAGEAVNAQKANRSMIRALGRLQGILEAGHVGVIREVLDRLVQHNDVATEHFSSGTQTIFELLGSAPNEYGRNAEALARRALNLTTGNVSAGEGELTIPQRVEKLRDDLDFFDSTFRVLLDKVDEVNEGLISLGLDFQAVEGAALTAADETIKFRDSI